MLLEIIIIFCWSLCEIEEDQGEEKYCIVQLEFLYRPLAVLEPAMLADDYFVLFFLSHHLTAISSAFLYYHLAGLGMWL